MVAVVVPVRNDARRLAMCLRRLVAQTVPAAQREIVVVDNGSSDDVAGVVAAFPEVRLLREPRRGSYAARNRGLAGTTAPLLAFTDADCLPAPDWLARGVAVLHGDPAVDLVAGRIEVFPRVPGRPTAIELHEALTAFPQRHFVERWRFGATANLFVRRSVVDAVGPFDAALESGGDAEFGERAAAAGHRIVYRDDVLVHHPARHRVAELVEKFTRITRGIEQLTAARGEVRPFAATLAGDLVRPWTGLPALLRDDRIPRRRDRVRVFGVTLLAASLTAYQLTATRLARRARPAPAPPGPAPAPGSVPVAVPVHVAAPGSTPLAGRVAVPVAGPDGGGPGEVAWAGGGRGDGS